MKATSSSCLVLAAGLVSVFASSLASLVPFNAVTFSVVIGGVASIGILGFAFEEYTRKPRFPMPTSRQSAAESTVPANPPGAEAIASWTYQTISA